MTSDAKIGLLLGLVFIFIIAFIINGLPSFHRDKSNNELTTRMVNSQSKDLGIGARERKVIEQNEPIIKYPPVVWNPPKRKTNIRFETPLPKSPPDKKEIVEIKSVAPSRNLPVAKNTPDHKVQPKKPTLPKIHIVEEGENLSVIAEKFYGPDEGNKLINITRIFQANRKLLKSPDEIYEGQKIIIPPLPTLKVVQNKIGGTFPATMFKEVPSIGKRHLSNEGSKAKQNRQYIVRDGDSLWRIAAEQLGNGTLYKEIARLNADILDDEDHLAIGMHLKLPVR